MGFKVWCGILAVGFLFALYIVQAKQSDREQFVKSHVLEQCTIFESYMRQGKSASYQQTLRCPGPVALRSEEVSGSTYFSTKIGDSVTVYYSKDRPAIWSRDLPTREWDQKKTETEWLVFVVVLGIVVAIFIGVHFSAQHEKEFLEKAEILDAEIVKVSVGEGKTQSTIRVRFLYGGAWREETLTVANQKMNIYFETRKTRVAVTPSACKALDSLMFVELVP